MVDWKTDSDLNESEMEPYSSFQSNKSGKLFDRMELPIILIGAGLLALVILFVVFIPKKNELTIDDYKHLVSRIDQLEQKIDGLSGTDIDIREFDPSQNPVQYQQLINWIKSNAEVISETIKKVDEIEKNLTRQPPSLTAASKPETAKSVARKTDTVAKPKTEKKTQSPEKTATVKKSPAPVKTAAENKPIEKSAPVQVKLPAPPQAETSAKPAVTPKAAAAPPKPSVPPKPVVDAEPIPERPETVKMIFHRVEKGETLYRISRKYGISVEKLQELNDMKKDDLLINVGQELIVRKEKQ